MRIKTFLPYLAVIILFAPLLVSAAIPRGGMELSGVVALIDKASDWLYVIGFAIALLVIIIGGISYMTAGGNEDRQKTAKKTIITGLVGAAIVLLAGIILGTLASFIGANPSA